MFWLGHCEPVTIGRDETPARRLILLLGNEFDSVFAKTARDHIRFNIGDESFVFFVAHNAGSAHDLT
jgi:hypothetical protein